MGFSSIITRIASTSYRKLLSSNTRCNRSTLSASSCWFHSHVSNKNDDVKNVESSLPVLSPSAAYHVSSGGYMRGTVFWEPNKPLTIEEFHIPRPKAGELLIKTKGTFLFSLSFYRIEMGQFRWNLLSQFRSFGVLLLRG